MSDVVVFDLLGLLQFVGKYPCDIPQQCSLGIQPVFVLHPSLFFALVGFACFGWCLFFWLLEKYNFGVDLHE